MSDLRAHTPRGSEQVAVPRRDKTLYGIPSEPQRLRRSLLLAGHELTGAGRVTLPYRRSFSSDSYASEFACHTSGSERHECTWLGTTNTVHKGKTAFSKQTLSGHICTCGKFSLCPDPLCGRLAHPKVGLSAQQHMTPSVEWAQTAQPRYHQHTLTDLSSSAVTSSAPPWFIAGTESGGRTSAWLGKLPGAPSRSLASGSRGDISVSLGHP